MDRAADPHAPHPRVRRGAARLPGPAQQVLLPDPARRARRRRDAGRGAVAGRGRHGRRRLPGGHALAPEADGRGPGQRRPRDHRVPRVVRHLRAGLAAQRVARDRARLPPRRVHPRRHLLLPVARAVLLHAAGPRQARERGAAAHPPLRGGGVPPDPGRRGHRRRGHPGAEPAGLGGGAGRGRRVRAPDQEDPRGGDRGGGPEQGPPDGDGHHDERDADGLVPADRAAGAPPARLGRPPDLPARRQRRGDAGLPGRRRACRARRGPRGTRAAPPPGDRDGRGRSSSTTPRRTRGCRWRRPTPRAS